MMSVSSKPSNQKYSILIGCSLMLTIAYMSLSSWGMATAELQKTFNLSAAMSQAGNAALIAGYGVGSFIEGKLLGKVGWKKTFLFAMALFLGGSILIPFVSNYSLVILLRFLMGFGLIVNITCALVGSWFPTRQRGLAVGILVGCIGLGSALGGVVIAAMADAGISWQNMFLIMAAISAAGVVVFLLMVKDPPAQLAEEDDAGAVLQDKEYNGNIYKEPALWLFAMALLCVFFNVYGMYAFIAVYLASLGFSTGQVAQVVFWNGFIAVLSTPIGGWLSDFWIKKSGNVLKGRSYATGVGALIGFVGCMVMPHLAPMGIGAAILVAIIAGWGCPATNSPILSLPADIFGNKAAGPVLGVVILIAGVGGIVAPIFVPWISDAMGWTVGWYLTGLAGLICFAISMALPKFEKKAKN